VTDIPVLIGGQRFAVYTRLGNPEVYQPLRQTAIKWWQDYILSECPPPINELDTAAIEELFPSADPLVEIRASEKDEKTLYRLRQCGVKMKTLDTTATALKNRIKFAMGEARVMQSTLGTVRWASSNDSLLKRRFTIKWKGEDDGQ